MALKILLLTPRIPYPLRDGGSIAMNQTLEGYVALGFEVSLLTMNTSRHWVEENTLPPVYQNLSIYRSVYLNTRINPLSAFFNLFTDQSYNVARFIDKEFEKELIALLNQEEFDIIQFESIYTAPYLKTVRKYSQAKCVCRVHNIEYQIWQRLSENENSFLKRKYLELLTNRLKSFELDILQKFDVLLPISKKEEEFFLNNSINKCYYLPFGTDTTNEIPLVNMDVNSIFHIGSMDWAPNVEGVQWFLDHVWNIAQHELKQVSLFLAGKNMPPSMRSRESDRLHIVGEVDDVKLFSLEKNIMIVPILSGAGIRIKIIEAMSLGKTIVTTSTGAEGIGATSGQHLLVADTPALFCEALYTCFAQPEEALRIGRNAREFVQTHYQKEKIYADLAVYFEQLT